MLPRKGRARCCETHEADPCDQGLYLWGGSQAGIFIQLFGKSKAFCLLQTTVCRVWVGPSQLLCVWPWATPSLLAWDPSTVRWGPGESGLGHGRAFLFCETRVRTGHTRLWGFSLTRERIHAHRRRCQGEPCMLGANWTVRVFIHIWPCCSASVADPPVTLILPFISPFSLMAKLLEWLVFMYSLRDLIFHSILNPLKFGFHLPSSSLPKLPISQGPNPLDSSVPSSFLTSQHFIPQTSPSFWTCHLPFSQKPILPASPFSPPIASSQYLSRVPLLCPRLKSMCCLKLWPRLWLHSLLLHSFITA